MINDLEKYKPRFFEELSKIGVGIDEKKFSMLCRYYEMVVEKNEVMNLTAITEPADFVVKHFLDSAYVAVLTDLSGKRIIDVGTGAGFPGMVLKILFPDMEIVLLDSLRKRVDFLKNVITELGLSGIEAIHGRAEELGQDENFRESFDICVSRAVSDLPVLSELCIPFVKVGGEFVAYKSVEASDEISRAQKAIETFGGKFKDVKSFSLSHPETGEKFARDFVIISKVEFTPSKYPRRPGIPGKKPIII